MRKTPAGSVCDDHPELGPMTDEEAWEHLKIAHPVIAEWSERVVEEIAKANRPEPRHNAGGKRKRRKRRRR